MPEEAAKKIEESVEKAGGAVGKIPWIWIRNSRGQKSASLTLAVIAFVVTTVWLALSIVGTVGGIAVTPFDSTVAMAYLAPCLALYFSRRHTKSKEELAKNGHV